VKMEIGNMSTRTMEGSIGVKIWDMEKVERRGETYNYESRWWRDLRKAFGKEVEG